jgi:broad specificity phosphatase PhoE
MQISIELNLYIIASLILCLFSSYFWLKPLLQFISSKIVILATQYAKRRRPKRIILVRHGESEANVDHSVYSKIPDNKISLTEKGKEQAHEAAKKLKEIIGDGGIKFYVSPYLRGRQTFEILSSVFDKNNYTEIVDPRIREQEFHNLKEIDREEYDKKIRRLMGKFYFRFTNGESGADVYDRVSLFLETLFREIDDVNRHPYENVVLVCHGLLMRLFVMRYFKWSVEKFDLMANPTNCEIWILEKNHKHGYDLKSEIREDPTYSD